MSYFTSHIMGDIGDTEYYIHIFSLHCTVSSSFKIPKVKDFQFLSSLFTSKLSPFHSHSHTKIFYLLIIITFLSFDHLSLHLTPITLFSHHFFHQKCGRGVMNWVRLDETYVGDWEDDAPHGLGEHIWGNSASIGISIFTCFIHSFFGLQSFMILFS